MTYYEHFGLTPQANQEEIHKAYRLLCRLMHPDHQTRGDLRTLAESQMRWVNEIYQTLRDPERRREYDRSLEAAVPDGQIERAPSESWVIASQQWRGTLLWYGLAAIAAAVLAWVLSGHRIGGHRLEAQAPVAPSGAIPARKRNSATLSLPTRAMREKAHPAKEAHRQAAVPPEPAEAPLALLPPLVATPDPLAARPVLGSIEWVTPPRRFHGIWAYFARAGPETARPAALYAPEFIETAIVETGATIEGRYRARYVIPDRAISPNVAFHFTGVVEGEEARLVWEGSGGAKGEGRLRLLSGSSIELSWAATEMGPELGLAAGRAVLVRQAGE